MSLSKKNINFSGSFFNQNFFVKMMSTEVQKYSQNKNTWSQINFSYLVLAKNICWLCPTIVTLVPYFVRVNHFEPQGLLKLFSFNKCLYTKPFEWKFYRRVKSNSFNWLLLNKFVGLWHNLNKLFFLDHVQLYSLVPYEIEITSITSVPRN